MQKFSFTEKKDLLIPNTATFRPLKDKNGNVLSGDELMRKMGNIITAWTTKHKKPIPIADQRFIEWVKQFNRKLAEGKTSDEIFKETLAGTVNV